MGRQEAESPEKATDHISWPEQRKLWVLAGGRCALCNKYLLEDDYTHSPINLAEMAHNVGKGGAKSPRSDDKLEVSERNKAENLLLMCGDHHKQIDTKEFRERYPVSVLKALKQKHEARIRLLTDITEDQSTLIFRVIAKVRNNVFAVPTRVAQAAVSLATGKYAKPITLERDIEVSLVDIPNEGTTGYFDQARQKIDETFASLDRILQEHHISLFACGRVPILVYLGWKIGNKTQLDIYDHFRDGIGWQWPGEVETVSYEAKYDPALTFQSHRAVLTVEVSGTIPQSDVDSLAKGDPVIGLCVSGRTPEPGLLRSPADLQVFGQTLRSLVAELEVRSPGLKELHLLSATPISASIELGRHWMSGRHPKVVLYDRQDSGYVPVLEINSEKV